MLQRQRKIYFSTHKLALCFVHSVHWGIHSKELLFLVIHNTNCQDKKENCHDKELRNGSWFCGYERNISAAKKPLVQWWQETALTGTTGAELVGTSGLTGAAKKKKLWDWRKWDEAFGNEAARHGQPGCPGTWSAVLNLKEALLQWSPTPD